MNRPVLKLKIDEAQLLSHLLCDLAEGNIVALEYNETDYMGSRTRLNKEGRALARSLEARLNKAAVKAEVVLDDMHYYDVFELVDE